MKKVFYIILLFSILNIAKAYAQTYLVYTVSGEVLNISSKKAKVVPKQKLNGAAVIRLGNNSRLVLLDEKNRQLCTLQTPIEGKIQDLIRKSGNSMRSVSKQYVSYLLKKNTSTDNKKNTHMQSTAVSYRDIDIFTQDSVEIKNDSIE